MSDVATILQDLYDAEINFKISTFWDGGFNAALGDQINGFDATATFDTLVEAVQFLAAAADQRHPNWRGASARVAQYRRDRKAKLQ